MEVPKASGLDTAHALVKGGIGSIPVIGNFAAETFNLLIAPPLTKRQNEWMQSVGESLDELMKKKSLTIDDLKQNEEFISIITRASRLAIQTHQAEKLDAFRNAVLNTAVPASSEESLRHMFLDYIDSMTVWHIRILKLFTKPQKWFIDNKANWPQSYLATSLDVLIYATFKDLQRKQDLLTQICRELRDKGLADFGIDVSMSPEGLKPSRLKPLGVQFIAFIEPPLL